MSTKEQNSVWQKTKTQHLIRYLPKGTFYAYFKVGGKPFRKSLRTDVYSVAKLRLRDELAEQHELAEASSNQAAGRLTFADIVEQYRARIESDQRLKPASRHYRLMTLDFIVKTWPATLAKKIGKITHRECVDWLRRYETKYASSVVNNSIGTLRAICDGLKPQDRLTGLIYWFDLLFEAPRGALYSKLASGVDQHWNRIRVLSRHSSNAAYEASATPCSSNHRRIR